MSQEGSTFDFDVGVERQSFDGDTTVEGGRFISMIDQLQTGSFGRKICNLRSGREI